MPAKQKSVAAVDVCGTCRYSRMMLNPAGKPDLYCRRYPKQALVQLTTMDGKLTKTGLLIGHVSVSATEDWCGEYKFDAAPKTMPIAADQSMAIGAV